LKEESEKIGNDVAAFDMFVGDFMNVKAKVPESWFAAQKQASAAGELMVCALCDEEGNPSFLPEEMLPCLRGHYFCKICIAHAANVAVRLRQTHVDCMFLNCDQCFSVSTIRQVLPAYSDFLLASLNDELHRAEIEGLEKCPKCPFAIPMGPIDPGDKSIPINSVFECQKFKTQTVMLRRPAVCANFLSTFPCAATRWNMMGQPGREPSWKSRCLLQ
jgi:hypothetical protein